MGVAAAKTVQAVAAAEATAVAAALAQQEEELRSTFEQERE